MAIVGLVSLAWADTPRSTPDVSESRCNALASTNFSNIQDAPTQVLEAKLIAASGDAAAFCQVQGYVMPNVGFKLLLPASNWNHKLFEFGCGGSCGLTDSQECEEPVRKGYACIVSDTGHRSAMYDGLWADNNLQAQVDFGYRGIHVVTVSGKAVTEHYYGKAPEHAYFMGGSTGGRQALVEAQRFPWDFDGIIALMPWIDDTASTMTEAWAVLALKDKDGKPIVSHSDLQLVHDAALAKCDMDDGVKDGLIANPLACHFDPTDLVCKAGKSSECITQAQAEAVKKVYVGPTNSKGERTFVRGAMPASELNWEGYLVNTMPVPTSTPIVEVWATEYFRYMIMPARGSSWELTHFDFDRDYKIWGTTSESLLNAGNPDLRRFKAAGGKLIIIQGWNDPLGAIPEKTIDYYETVERTMGGRAATQEFVRLFMVPGMAHCYPCLKSASVIDYLGYLEAWGEHGKAPDKMVGAHVSESYLAAQAAHVEVSPIGPQSGIPEFNKLIALGHLRFPLDPAIPVTFTRPIYPYPTYAKYSGSGDPNQAGNFVPVEP